MDRSAIEAIQQTAMRAQVVPASDGLEPLAIVPGGHQVLRLTDFRTTKDRIAQALDLLTADSFIAYWKRFAKADSVIFADERTGKYVAVIDYHTAGNDPRFCEHIGTFQAQSSLEWQTWMGSNGRPVPQAQFARFMEDNYVDVVEPAHADMIAIATNLKAKKAVEFASSTDLTNGQVQFLYEEKISGSADKRQGSIKIPDSFVISVPVLLGDVRVRIEARLRYRIEEGKLSMWYDLHRPEHAKVAAIQRATAAIRKELPDAPFFLGGMR